MQGYSADIVEKTTTNTNFRQVLYTGTYMQLVVMSLKPGEEIGEEVHGAVDQFFRVEEGVATFIIDGEEILAVDDTVVIVPAGAKHNVINTGTVELKLYTIYSPPNHPEGTVHKDKAEADAAEAAEHGV
jgi:mannose-6-phosphate isomerase-like protein (cupin superfamily)